ncbi:hypothetical protein ABKU91_23415 [Enterobacter hormaechei]|uniref:hypothetical protein n=1 Tax=unclassified Enterobacter cloacae complex TaxID=2757714 RepID=UPI0032B0E843
MPKITFCPHHILNIDPNLDPRVIEKFYVMPLIDFIKACKVMGLKVSISQTLLEMFEELHPWSLGEDVKWTKWLADWHAVLKPLLNDMDIVVHPITGNVSKVRCAGITKKVNDIFCDFINYISTHTFHDKTNEEAIYTPTPMCINYNDFINIKEVKDIKFAKYTWYKIYPDNLPSQGDFPFVPPQHWRKSAKPLKAGKPNYGFLDDKRREWHWDKFHKDHWDVQNPGGGLDDYTNVTPEGKILRE